MASNASAPHACEIMHTEIVTVPAQMTVVEAARLLQEKAVSSAPVVERDMKRETLVGFISEKDVMQCYADGVLYEQPYLKVSEIMRPDPISVREETDIYALAVIFVEHGFQNLPVTTGHVLKGMVSRSDVLKALMEHYNRWTRKDAGEHEAPDIKAVFTPRNIPG